MGPGLAGQPPLGALQNQVPLQRPGMPGMPGLQAGRPSMHPGMQQGVRMGGPQMPGMPPMGGQGMNRGQTSLMPTPGSGQGLIRAPPPGHRLHVPNDPRAPQPRPEWDRPMGFSQQNQPRGPGPLQHGGGPHVNYGYFPLGQAPQNGMSV